MIQKDKIKNYNIYGYFIKGGHKWIIVNTDFGVLSGISISPKGKIHTLVIDKDEIDELVLLD